MVPQKSFLKAIVRLLTSALILAAFLDLAPSSLGAASAGGTAILSQRDRVVVQNAWLKWRLDNIIPSLMRREGIDLWLVINREYTEDPVYLSLMPRPTMNSGGTVALIFDDRGAAGVERLSCSPHAVAALYKNIRSARTKTQFETLADFIRERNPGKIGIDVSANWPLADGLTASLKDKLEKALGPELSKRFVPAENLVVGWLETRSPEEQSVYRQICGIAHGIIADFLSNNVITPDVTTTDDVVWWARQRVADLGLETWFQPSLSIVRAKAEEAKYADRRTIRRGDLLHCDFGIRYLGLCTDMQWHAYVCKAGEEDAPQGLKDALRRANQLADLIMNEFKEGRSGQEITSSVVSKGESAGLRPSIYSHPLGFYGHAAGMTPDSRSVNSIDEGNPLRWNYPLHLDTAYAIEFSSASTVPEWDNQDVRIAYEETAIFTGAGCRFVDGRQTKFLIIK